VLVAEPEPHVSHLLTVTLPVVRQHVDDDRAAAWLEDASDLGQRSLRLRDVMQHDHERRRVQPSIVDRQRLEIAAPEFDVVEAVQPLFRRLQHGRRAIDGDHARDERREGRAHLTRAAAEIADGPVALREGRQRRQVKTIAEQVVADAIPLAGRR
jgi:hypothetical protein